MILKNSNFQYMQKKRKHIFNQNFQSQSRKVAKKHKRSQKVTKNLKSHNVPWRHSTGISVNLLSDLSILFTYKGRDFRQNLSLLLTSMNLGSAQILVNTDRYTDWFHYYIVVRYVFI